MTEDGTWERVEKMGAILKFGECRALGDKTGVRRELKRQLETYREQVGLLSM